MLLSGQVLPDAISYSKNNSYSIGQLRLSASPVFFDKLL
jgi:colanic acid/amylovoran biosynthesis glycosyltransferase